jgi:hypothetical protein
MVLADAVATPSVDSVHPDSAVWRAGGQDKTRVSLRMRRDEAHALFAAARAAGMPLGSFVAGLAAGVPALLCGSSPRDYTSALIASNAELATLSRNLYDLARLLRHGTVRAAQEYLSVLEALDADIRNHLALVSEALAQLQPRRACLSRTRSTRAPISGEES